MKSVYFLSVYFLFGAIATIGQSSWALEVSESIGPMAGGPVAANTRLGEAIEGIKSNREIREVLRNDDLNSLTPSQIVSGAGIETVKFQHYFKGLEVIGAMAMHHKGPSETVVRSSLAPFDLDEKPAFDAQAAASLALSVVGDRGLKNAPVLKILPDHKGSARLVYWVEVKAANDDAARDVIIDAHSGKIIANLSKQITLAPIQVYSSMRKQADGGYLPVEGCQQLDSRGWPASIDLKSCNHVVINSRATQEADQSARRAARNTLAVLKYFKLNHNRDSFDNRGTDTTSLVHAGSKFSNAAWDSEQNLMIYGDGNPERDGTTDFTKALDVAGHEMTHGVTSYTANLTYMDEPGALNEAFSDFFGKLVANDGDWSIGRKLFIDYEKSKGFRNLADPASMKFEIREGEWIRYPAHVKEKIMADGTCDRSNDYCWVHVNSTIPGHASYLVYSAIGREKSQALYYTILTQFLTASSNFQVLKEAVSTACRQLFGNGMTCDQVAQSYARIGL